VGINVAVFRAFQQSAIVYAFIHCILSVFLFRSSSALRIGESILSKIDHMVSSHSTLDRFMSVRDFVCNATFSKCTTQTLGYY
jgi:hypothetical protein